MLFGIGGRYDLKSTLFENKRRRDKVEIVIGCLQLFKTNKIVIYTARGSGSGINYKELVKSEYVNDLIEKKPDIVWVSLGFPKQEEFIDLLLKNNNLISNFVAVGAVFEWSAGTKIKAPEILANIGLEWIFRLIQEPRRLYKRYFVDNFLFIIYIIKQIRKAKDR